MLVCALSGCRPGTPPGDPRRAITLGEAITKSNTLETLDLFTRKLNGFPPVILQFRQLKHLNLRTCSIGQLPDEIGTLTHLYRLDLSQTGLTNLTPAICHLSQLSYLWLNDNHLPALPPEMAALTNLAYLNADRTGLSSLPPGLGALANLKWLRLNNNQISAMPADMSGLAKNLKVLYLIGNPIQEAEKDRIRTALPACRVVFETGGTTLNEQQEMMK